MLVSKICTKCKEEKSIDNFPIRSDTKKLSYQSHCRSCRSSHRKEWSARVGYKSYDRAHAVKKKYGLEIEEYDRLFAEANGACQLCGRDHLRLVCDHDHETGKVRGVICTNCNTALGLANDDPVLLVRLAKYLIDNSQREAQIFAEELEKAIQPCFPEAWEALKKASNV